MRACSSTHPPRDSDSPQCEDPRPHAWRMCAAWFCSCISPIWIRTTTAITVLDIGDPHRVTYPSSEHATESGCYLLQVHHAKKFGVGHSLVSKIKSQLSSLDDPAAN